MLIGYADVDRGTGGGPGGAARGARCNRGIEVTLYLTRTLIEDEITFVVGN